MVFWESLLCVGTIFISLKSTARGEIDTLVNSCNSDEIKRVDQTTNYRLQFSGNQFPSVCKSEFIGRDEANEQRLQVCVSTQYFQLLDCNMKVYIYEGYISTPKVTYTCRSTRLQQEVCTDIQKHLRIELIYVDDAFSITPPNVVNISFLITGKELGDEGFITAIVGSIVTNIVVIAIAITIACCWRRRKMRRRKQRINEQMIAEETCQSPHDDNQRSDNGNSPVPYHVLFPENCIRINTNNTHTDNGTSQFGNGHNRGMVGESEIPQRDPHYNHDGIAMVSIVSSGISPVSMKLPSYKEATEVKLFSPPSYASLIKNQSDIKPT